MNWVKQAETDKRQRRQKNKKQIVAYITKNGTAGSLELADLLQLSQSRVRVLLAELVDVGELFAKGDGRSRRYALADEQNA